MNILIVDDVPANRRLLRLTLEAEGHTVVEAADGLEALALLEREAVDAVISDALMPRLDGFQFCQTLRQHERLSALPFILYSSTFSSAEDEKLSRQMGADKFLSKPAGAAELCAAVKEAPAYSRLRREARVMPIEKKLERTELYAKQLVQKLQALNAELAESEQRFRALFEQAAVGIACVDLNGRFLSVNQHLARIAGRTCEDLLTCTFQQIIHSDDLTADLAEMERLLTGDSGSYSVEKRFIRKDGSLVWVNLIRSLVRGQTGDPKYFILVAEDISTSKLKEEAEAALKSIEWMLAKRPAVDRSGTTGQAYGDITLLNTDRTILDAVGKDLLHDIVSDYMNLLETSSAVYEKNGDYAYGIFSSGWCQAMDQASFRGCGTSDSRAALRCGKWHCHESCWNEASRKSIETKGPTDIECAGGIRLHAVPIQAGDEIVGSINFGYGDPPRDPARLRELAAKYGLSIEELRRNAEAYERRPPFIIELAKQRLLGSARLIGEIVQRKRAQVALQRLNATLEQRVRERASELELANKELGSFAYSVSHDLRAPLRGIDGWSQALLEDYAGKLDERGRDYLHTVRSETQRMSALIDDLLQLSSVTRAELRRELVDLSAVARTVAESLQREQPARKVEWAIAPGLTAQGDILLVRVVLENLLGNAWKFTGHRAQGIIEFGTLAAEAPEVRKPESEIDRSLRPPAAIFFVRDNGAGFDMAYAAKLFSPFQRLHKPSEFPGTGIGLATVQRIVHRHGGKVWAEARVEEGAAFYFTLGGARTDSKCGEIPQPSSPSQI